MSWKDVASELKPDGFFLEVKVRGADLDDWQAVLDRIASLAANPVYTVDGVARESS